MFRKLTSLLSLSALLVLGLALPAAAHEEINPNNPTVGKPVFLTLTAANEKTVDLTKITLTAPSDLPFGTATHEPTGWTVNHTDTVLTWSGGKVAPERFETWGFEIEGADQAKAYSYKVTLGFADGSSEPVTVVINAVAGGAVGSSTTLGSSGTTVTTSSTATTQGSAPNPIRASKSDGTARGLAVGALALALIALVVAAARSRRVPATPPTEGPGTNEW